MDQHTATELAYKNGYEAGRHSCLWHIYANEAPSKNGKYLCIIGQQPIIAVYSTIYDSFAYKSDLCTPDYWSDIDLPEGVV